MRRCIAVWLVLGVLLLAVPPALAAEEPVLPAKAYIVMDGTTGKVLHEYAASQPLPMASTTKIMTAILALERGKPSDIVTVGRKPYETGGSTIYLEIGEQQSLHNLLLALMLESSNDAAVAIAEHLAGSEERFVDWMNEKAREIGAKNTHFANSHGLHAPDHYSTAHDLALIARYAMQNEAFRQLIVVEEATIPGYRQNPERKLQNHNRLLGYYAGANGIKNGFTDEADLTNVASARRGDTELIAVVLGAKDRLWTTSMTLLDFGFSHYRTVLAVKKGEQVGSVSVGGTSVPAVADENLWVTVPLDGPPLERRLSALPGLTEAPRQGARLGTLRVLSGGGEEGSIPVLSGRISQSDSSRLVTHIPVVLSRSRPLKPGSLELLLIAAGIALGVARRRRFRGAVRGSRRFSA